MECVRPPAARCLASPFSNVLAPRFLAEDRRARLLYAPVNGVRCIRRASRLRALVPSALAPAFPLRVQHVPAAGPAVHLAAPVSAMFHAA